MDNGLNKGIALFFAALFLMLPVTYADFTQADCDALKARMDKYYAAYEVHDRLEQSYRNKYYETHYSHWLERADNEIWWTDEYYGLHEGSPGYLQFKEQYETCSLEVSEGAGAGEFAEVPYATPYKDYFRYTDELRQRVLEMRAEGTCGIQMSQMHKYYYTYREHESLIRYYLAKNTPYWDSKAKSLVWWRDMYYDGYIDYAGKYYSCDVGTGGIEFEGESSPISKKECETVGNERYCVQAIRAVKGSGFYIGSHDNPHNLVVVGGFVERYDMSSGQPKLLNFWQMGRTLDGCVKVVDLLNSRDKVDSYCIKFDREKLNQTLAVALAGSIVFAYTTAAMLQVVTTTA